MAGRRRSILALGLLIPCITPVYSGIGSETISYAYDARGRLVQVNRNGAQANYGYDKADNRSNVTVTTSTPTFSINSASATEGSPIVFTVTKTGTASGTLTVNYGTSGGTATSAADFTASSGTLTFLASDPSKTISVPTSDDASVEGAETFSVTLSSASAGSAIGAATGTGTINDNDSAPTCGGVSVSIVSNGAVTEGVNAGFTISKSGSTAGSCSVNYATANGSAVAPGDYTAKAITTLTFTSGQASQAISVTTVNDSAVESTETFTMNLTSPSGGAAIGTGTATATINDNDTAATCSGVSFRVSDDADDEGTPLGFVVTKSGSTTSSCGVSYATANGTAITPNDYATVSGTLTFAANETTKTVSVTTVIAGPGEGDEYMYLDLSSPTGGATITDSRGQGTIYNYFDDGGGCPLC
jgi:YD repeat-containing protein